jgi:hypothetical protein
MLGYLYDTEILAQAAVAEVNAYYGIPVSPDAVTQTYTDFIAWNDKWAILFDDSLVAVLGDAVELPIIEDEQP